MKPIELLRFTTAGSVDDGKSTLIGRLLYDSKAIFEDQLAAVEQASESRGDEEVDLALLTDGLRAEREQKITIDVAYRYFATPAANSSSPTPPATSNTPATWSPAPPPPNWPSS
jgi:sulfate adenylyltransferase subunit 1 (EFTu-like GTPase family)